MKTSIQKGRVLDLIAPYNVTNAPTYVAGMKVGSIIALAASTALSGAPVEGYVEGVYTVQKATGSAWTVGLLLYWDDAAKNFTTVSTSNTKAAYATIAAASGDVVGTLKLVPSI